MKLGILLSGCGVFDGSAIQEVVCTMLAIKEKGLEYICFAPDIMQHHVVDHRDATEMENKRNVLIESSRIARGDIRDLSTVNISDFDGLIIPGGFGVAKNLTSWAQDGPQCSINSEVKRIILETVLAKKPLVALCMGPTVVAKALEGTGFNAQLSVGSINAKSPYDIDGISKGIEAIGHSTHQTLVSEITIDQELSIISAPCYMMDTDILGVKHNIDLAITALIEKIKE